MRLRFWLIGLAVLAVVGSGAVFGLRWHKQTTQPKQTASSNQAAQTAATGDYIALGDSVAAGLGLATSGDSVVCGQTREAYPELVASTRQLHLHTFACSGAQAAAGILDRETVDTQSLAPQLSQALDIAKPTLISISVGANDVGWTRILTDCYREDCVNGANDDIFSNGLGELADSLHDILTKLHDQYGGTAPRVVVTGYYQLFGGDNACNAGSGISPAEIAWWRSKQAILNAQLQSTTAGFANARFAAVSFAGHDLCSDDPWVQPVQGAAPFHPTAAGQAAIARAVVAASR